jgi:transposase
MADVCSTTLTSYMKEYAEGGIEALKTVKFNRPRSKLDDHRQTLEEHFRTHPPATVKDAMAAIETLTGLKRSHERTRTFLKRIGMKRRKAGTIPAKAKVEAQAAFKKGARTAA